MSFKLSLGKRTIAGCDLFTNEAIAALHILDHDVVDRDYLYWALGSIDYDRHVDRAAKGKTLNKAKLKLLRIPLPSLIEQRRVARILDAADGMRATRRESLAQLESLLKSVFLDMFGDPITNPMGWTKVKSREVFLLPPKIGTVTPAKGRGHLVVRVGELGESRIAFERCGRVEIAAADVAKFRLEPGDTVVARAIGSKSQLGKASYFDGFDEVTVVDSHVMRLRPDPTKCDGRWLYSLIASDAGKRSFSRRVAPRQSSSTSMPSRRGPCRSHCRPSSSNTASPPSLNPSNARRLASALTWLNSTPFSTSLQSRAFRGGV